MAIIGVETDVLLNARLKLGIIAQEDPRILQIDA
jgi:hypothetical protein